MEICLWLKGGLYIEKIASLTTNSQVKKELLLLNYLQKSGEKSRVDIAGKLNLTKASVTVITNDMLQSGVLVEKGEKIVSDEARTRGRRKILIDINENYKLVFGITIDDKVMVIGLTNLKGQPLDKKKIIIKDKSYRELLELIVASITETMKNNWITNEKILALGLSLSESGGAFIEGTKLSDKLVRLKKDLAHALPMKIAVGTLMFGSIIAQKLFTTDNTQSMLMLRYGQAAESGLLLNGKSYLGATGNAGGFRTLLEKNKVQENISELPAQIAQTIITCNSILDTEKIFYFGRYFENIQNIHSIGEHIAKLGYKKLQLQQAKITDDTLFLSPCAIAIDYYFYFNNP